MKENTPTPKVNDGPFSHSVSHMSPERSILSLFSVKWINVLLLNTLPHTVSHTLLPFTIPAVPTDKPFVKSTFLLLLLGHIIPQL